MVGISDTDTNDIDNSDIDNSSVTSESQSIDINLRTKPNNVSNDCDSPSIEVHNTPMLNTTLDNHLDSGNIATRVRAKNEKVRKTHHSLSVPLAQKSVNAYSVWFSNRSYSPSYTACVCENNPIATSEIKSKVGFITERIWFLFDISVYYF